jgi:FkbM family methyltransferase
MSTTFEGLTFQALSHALHRWPFSGGLIRVSNHPLVWKLIARGSTETHARLRNGDSIRVRLRDFDGRVLALFGTPDCRVTTVCRSLARQGDVFLDIGANHGAVGLMVSEEVGPQGRVHLFEPQPDLCGRIRETLQRKGDSSISLHEVGLLDEDGELELYPVRGHSGRGSFVPDDDEFESEAARLPIRDAATYLPPLIGGRSWAAKVDIEGAESRILPILLKIPRLRFLVVESSHLGDPRPLWASAKQAGLVVFGICRSALRPRLKPLSSASEIGDYEDLVLVRLATAPRSSRTLSPAVLRRLLPS